MEKTTSYWLDEFKKRSRRIDEESGSVKPRFIPPEPVDLTYQVVLVGAGVEKVVVWGATESQARVAVAHLERKVVREKALRGAEYVELVPQYRQEIQ
jgi:hypothetical protein